MVGAVVFFFWKIMSWCINVNNLKFQTLFLTLYWPYKEDLTMRFLMIEPKIWWNVIGSKTLRYVFTFLELHRVDIHNSFN